MLAYLFLLTAVAVRFLPHPWMFTPVAASLLFFGARGPKRQLWLPFVMLAASDVVLTRVVYSYPFSWDHYVTWVWYAAIIWLGTNLRENSKPLRVIGAALASSRIFFSVEQFGGVGRMDGSLSENFERRHAILRGRVAIFPEYS